MDQKAYAERVTSLAEGLAIFNHHDMTRVDEESIAALKKLVGWVDDEDFYSNHANNPAKRAAKVLFKHWNSARSVERDALVHAKSEAVRGPAISTSSSGA